MTTDTDPAPAGLDIAALRRVAEAATPGPWEAIDDNPHMPIRIVGAMDGDSDDNGRPVFTCEHVCEIADTTAEDDNARFIAAWNPATALALLDELERAREAAQTFNEWRYNTGKRKERAWRLLCSQMAETQRSKEPPTDPFMQMSLSAAEDVRHEMALEEIADARRRASPPEGEVASETESDDPFLTQPYRQSARAELAAECERLARRVAELEAERGSLLEALSEAARARGEAEGKLMASEWPGVVDGWKARAQAAEAQRDAALEVLEPFAAWADTVERDFAAKGVGDACPIVCNFQRIASGGDVTVGQFRAARDFIRNAKGGE